MSFLKRWFGGKNKNCKVCGRKLYSKKSQQAGVGAFCARKLNPQAALESEGQQRLFDETSMDKTQTDQSGIQMGDTGI